MVDTGLEYTRRNCQIEHPVSVTRRNVRLDLLEATLDTLVDVGGRKVAAAPGGLPPSVAWKALNVDDGATVDGRTARTVVKLLEDALGTDLRAQGFPPVIS